MSLTDCFMYWCEMKTFSHTLDMQSMPNPRREPHGFCVQPRCRRELGTAVQTCCPGREGFSDHSHPPPLLDTGKSYHVCLFVNILDPSSNQISRLRPWCSCNKEQFGNVRSNQRLCWNALISCLTSFIQRKRLKYQLGFSSALEKNVSWWFGPSDLNRNSSISRILIPCPFKR